MDYEAIKALAERRGVSVKKLIAMSVVRDPFYVGKPADRAAAEWFADLWQRFGFLQRVHLRRVHYRLVSQSPPVTLWFGKPYENTETCWQNLLVAAAYARYLLPQRVPFEAFIDQRNPDPLLYTPPARAPVEVRCEIDETWSRWKGNPTSPKAPALWFPLLREANLPSVDVVNFTGRQRYHLEIWAEKSTMNDVLASVCYRYQVNLMTGSGELSITQVHKALERIIASGKPARIFYLSDFDPAGKTMPVSAARKLEWFASSTDSPLAAQLADADIRLCPVVLTQEQCIEYALPRTPIKEGEQRKGKFETQYGAGATELDALEALRPGRLAAIMRQALDPYWDWELSGRVEQAEGELREHLRERRHAVVAEHQEAIEAIQAEYRQLRAECAPLLEQLNDDYGTQLWALNERMRAEWDAIHTTLQEDVEQLDLEEWPIPEADEADETGLGDPLYDSARDYEEQLAAYKAFQGRAAEVLVTEEVAS